MLRAKNLLQIYSARNLWQEGAQREHPKVKLLLTKSHLKASNSCSTVDFRYSKADRAAPKHPNWRRREIVVFSFTKIMPTSAFCSGIENNRWSLSCTCSPFLSVKTWWLVIYTRLLEYKTRLFSKFPGLSCSPASTHPEVALGGGTDSTMHWGAYTLSAFQIIWKSWGGGGHKTTRHCPFWTHQRSIVMYTWTSVWTLSSWMRSFGINPACKKTCLQIYLYRIEHFRCCSQVVNVVCYSKFPTNQQYSFATFHPLKTISVVHTYGI